MTLANTGSRVDAYGNGVATVFSFSPVVIFAASNLIVTVRDALGVETALTQGTGPTNYSVNVAQFPGTGSITYPASGVSRLLTGQSITMKRVVPLIQNVALTNQSGYFAPVQEGAFDYGCAIDQQLAEILSRTLTTAPTDPPGQLILPSSILRANSILGFDSFGNPVPMSGISGGTLVSTPIIPFITAASLSAALAILGVSAAVQPALLGTLQNALNLIAGGGILTNNPNVPFGPVGNAFATLGSFVQQGTTTSNTLREFAGSFGLESYNGYGGVGAFGIRADKVALYSGIEGFANSADIWALNTVTRLAPGFPALSNSLGYELDFNNQAGARGAVAGLGGFASPTAIGLLVTGGSTFSSTAGISVQGSSNGQWYRGIGVASGVSQSSFYDYGTGTTGFEMQATHAWGIDMLGSVLGGAIRVPNNSGIYGRNNGNTSDVAIGTVDASNNLLIGVAPGGGFPAAGIYLGAGILPFSDNTFAIGSGGRRWTTLYATTSTINTSDPADKNDMATLPDVGDVIDAVSPISYKWKIGGFVPDQTEVVQMVQATEEVTYDDFDIAVQNGVATRTPVKRTKVVDLFDEVPMLGPDGNQLIEHVPAKPAQPAEFDENGNLVRLAVKAQPAVDIPLTHRVPRMVEAMGKTSNFVATEGKRLHFGYSADDVGKIADILKMEDCAAYVVDEDGKKHIRFDELSPIMWRELQAIRVRERAKDAIITTLLADMAALKQKVGF